jgi:hypothetical protein
MACFFRLLPYLRPEDIMPIVTRYLSARNDATAIDLATRDCRLPFLLDCLILMLEKTNDTQPICHAICAVLIQYRFGADLVQWSARDDRLYNFIASQDLFSSATFISLAILMKMRRLNHLGSSAQALLLPRRGTQHQWTPQHLQECRTLADDFLLSSACERNMAFLPDISSEDLVAEICTRVKQAMIIFMTDFLSACLQPDKPVYMAETMFALSVCIFDTCETVEAETMAKFATAWVTLAHHAAAHPEDEELAAVTSCLFSGSVGDANPSSWFYQPQSAPIFKEALSVFFDFLKKTRRPTQDIAHILDALMLRMRSDGS